MCTSFMLSATNVGKPIPICSPLFVGEEPAASTGGFAALDRSSVSSGDDGVDAEGSTNRDAPGVMAADINDGLLSS